MSKERENECKPKRDDIGYPDGRGAGGGPGGGGGGGATPEDVRKAFEDFQNQRGRTQEHSGPTPEEEKFYLEDDED